MRRSAYPYALLHFTCFYIHSFPFSLQSWAEISALLPAASRNLIYSVTQKEKEIIDSAVIFFFYSLVKKTVVTIH